MSTNERLNEVNPLCDSMISCIAALSFASCPQKAGMEMIFSYCHSIVQGWVQPPIAPLASACVSSAQYAREVNEGRNDRQRPPQAACINQATPTLISEKVIRLLCYNILPLIFSYLLQKVSLLAWLVGGILVLPSAQNQLKCRRKA